jgi:hypothetical protein
MKKDWIDKLGKGLQFNPYLVYNKRETTIFLKWGDTK